MIRCDGPYGGGGHHGACSAPGIIGCEVANRGGVICLKGVDKAMIEASAKPESTEPKTTEGPAAPPSSGPGEKDAIALYRQGRAAEAVAAFDKLLLEKPNDEGLKIWKALALLDQAQAMKESQASGYKPVVLNAWAIL